MSSIKLFAARLARSAFSSTQSAARKAIEQRDLRHPFPVIPTCPSPTCTCAEMPPNLSIEKSKNLNGTMAPYAQHVLVSSGQTDWASKIENEGGVSGWGTFTADLKRALGRGGKFQDPYNNILISASSFLTPPLSGLSRPAHGRDRVSMLLFPSFKYLLDIETNEHTTEDVIKGWLLPTTLHPSYVNRPESYRRAISRNAQITDLYKQHERQVRVPTILICSHGARDYRCGILGPLLRDEFEKYLNSQGILVSTSDFVHSPYSEEGKEHRDGTSSQTTPLVNIGMISHIGGHKWAGNVIIYIPPTPDELPGNNLAPPSKALAGRGIWYGRVEPKHIQGIVEQTILGGKVIKDLFRGGIDSDGVVFRL